jgi:DNA-binding protein H-NS
LPAVSEPGDRENAMSKPDLESMHFDELWAIHEELTKILSDKILAEKRELEKRLAKLNQSNVSREETEAVPSLGNRSPRRKYQKVRPKFRNPVMPSETWSGRGKQPRWLVAALKEGHQLEDMRIAPSDAIDDERAAQGSSSQGSSPEAPPSQILPADRRR